MGNRENIIEIENKIKQIVGDDPDGLKLIISKEVKEQLESLLFDRMCLLNGMFEWTPLNVQRVQKVNDHLKFLSDSLLERYFAIESKSSIICDNPAFDYDYEIDGCLRFLPWLVDTQRRLVFYHQPYLHFLSVKSSMMLYRCSRPASRH